MMHDAWCMVYGVWCMVHSVRRTVQRKEFTEMNMDEARPYDFDAPELRRAGKEMICPRDGAPGCAYVDYVASLGNGFVGRANVMLSYTWGYSIGAISSALMAFCERTSRDPSATYVWICCMCINQHRVAGCHISTEALQHEFESRVRAIGHVLSLLTPWDNPTNLTRSWCLFEIFIAIQLGKLCKLELIMPPAEAVRFMRSLLEQFAEIQIALARVDLEHAQASKPADREAINEMVRQGVGFVKANGIVIAALKRWLVEVAWKALDAMPVAERATSELINGLGTLLFDQGRLSDAELLFNEALDGRRTELGDRHESTLDSIGNLGALLLSQGVSLRDEGKLAQAEPLLREALAGKREQLGDTHPGTVASINNLGVLLQDQVRGIRQDVD